MWTWSFCPAGSGHTNLAANKTVTETCAAFAKAGRKVAAICAAPASWPLLACWRAGTPPPTLASRINWPVPSSTMKRSWWMATSPPAMGWAVPSLCTGTGAPAGRSGRGGAYPERHCVSALRRGCGMRFITCRLPDGVEDPAILSEDGRQVWPLSWLGLSYETLSEAIPFLTRRCGMGCRWPLRAFPLCLWRPSRWKVPSRPRHRMSSAWASIIWPTR